MRGKRYSINREEEGKNEKNRKKGRREKYRYRDWSEGGE